MAADVQVQPATVLQEDVARSSPRDDLAEEEARDLVGAQAPLSAQGEGDPVLGLDAVDPPQHDVTRADPQLKELADLVVAQAQERSPTPAVLEDAHLEVLDGDRAVGAAQGGDRVLQRGVERLQVRPRTPRNGALIVSASPPSTAKRGSSEIVPS